MYVIYITEFDIIKSDKTVYHLDTIIRETGDAINDGLHRIIVNGARNDGTKAARLVEHFKEKDFTDAEFPEISKRIKYYKHTTKGKKDMCKIMEDLIKEQNEYSNAKMMVNFVNNLMTSDNCSLEEACQKLHISCDEYLQSRAFIDEVNEEEYEFDYQYA